MSEKQEITREILQIWADDMENKMITYHINRLESALREQIAKEIENMEPQAADVMDTVMGKYWVARCAAIARGNSNGR